MPEMASKKHQSGTAREAPGAGSGGSGWPLFGPKVAAPNDPRAAGAVRRSSSLLNSAGRLLRRLPALFRREAYESPAEEWRRLVRDLERSQRRHRGIREARQRLSAHVHTMLREGR